MPEAAPTDVPDPAKFWRRIKRLGELLELMKGWEKGNKDEKAKKELIALSQRAHSMKRALGIRSTELDPLIVNWFAYLRVNQDIQTDPNIMSKSNLKALTSSFSVAKNEEAPAPPDTSLGAHQKSRNGKEVMVVVPAWVHAGKGKANGRKRTESDDDKSDEEEEAVQKTSVNNDQQRDSKAGVVKLDSHGEEVEDAEDAGEVKRERGAKKRVKEEVKVGGAQGVGSDDEIEEVEGPKQKERVKGKLKAVEEDNDAMEVDGGGRRRAQHDDDEWEEDREEEGEEVDEEADQQPTRPGKRRRSKQDEESGEAGKKADVQTKKKQWLMTIKEEGGSILISEVTPRPSEAEEYTPIEDFALFCTKCKKLKRQCWGRNGGRRACLSCHRGHRGLCLFSAYTKSKGSEDCGSSGDDEPHDRRASSKPAAQGKKRNVSVKAEPKTRVIEYGKGTVKDTKALVSKEIPLEKKRAAEHGTGVVDNPKAAVTKERPHQNDQAASTSKELPLHTAPGDNHLDRPTAKKVGVKSLIKQTDTRVIKSGVKDEAVVTQVKKSALAPTTSKEGSARQGSASSVADDTTSSAQIEAVANPTTLQVIRSTSAEKQGPLSARKVAQVNLRPVVPANPSEPRAATVNDELDRHAKRIFNAEGDMASIRANLEGLKRDATWRANDRDKISELEDKVEHLEKDHASTQDLLAKAQSKIRDHETSLTEMRSSLALLSAFWLQNTSLPVPASQNASLPPVPAASANQANQAASLSAAPSNVPARTSATSHHEGVAQPTHHAAGAQVLTSTNPSALYAARHAQQQGSLAPPVNQGHQATSINPSAMYEVRHAQQQEPLVNQVVNHPPPPDIAFQDPFLGEIPTSGDMSGWTQYIAGSSNRNIQQYPSGGSISMASAGRNPQLPYGSSRGSSSSGFRSSVTTMQDPYREEARAIHPSNMYPAPAASNAGQGDPSLYGLGVETHSNRGREGAIADRHAAAGIDPQSSSKQPNHLPQSSNIDYINGVEQPNTSTRNEANYHFASGTVPNPRVPLGGMDPGSGGDGGRFTIGTTRAEGSSGNLSDFDDRTGGIHDEGAEPRLNVCNGYQSSPHSEQPPDVQSVPYSLNPPASLSNVRNEGEGYLSSPLSEPPSDVLPVSFNPPQQISNIRSRLRTRGPSKPPPPIRRRKTRAPSKPPS